jgi:hypothetical protein
LDAVRNFIAEYPKYAVRALHKIALAVRRAVQGHTPHDTYEAMRSWGQVTRQSGGYSFGSEIPYMHVLELGLYPEVGEPHPGELLPRTVQTATGIYSTQAVEGWVRQIVEDPALMEIIVEDVLTQMKTTLSAL